MCLRHTVAEAKFLVKFMDLMFLNMLKANRHMQIFLMALVTREMNIKIQFNVFENVVLKYENLIIYTKAHMAMQQLQRSVQQILMSLWQIQR